MPFSEPDIFSRFCTDNMRPVFSSIASKWINWYYWLLKKGHMLFYNLVNIKIVQAKHEQNCILNLFSVNGQQLIEAENVFGKMVKI